MLYHLRLTYLASFFICLFFVSSADREGYLEERNRQATLLGREEGGPQSNKSQDNCQHEEETVTPATPATPLEEALEPWKPRDTRRPAALRESPDFPCA